MRYPLIAGVGDAAYTQQREDQWMETRMLMNIYNQWKGKGNIMHKSNIASPWYLGEVPPSTLMAHGFNHSLSAFELLGEYP
jgi:hypothetical protein